jgi:capsular polysaccharide biosynthesis protein
VDFVSALLVLGRHWLALLNGLILTLAASVSMLVAIPPTYQATSSAVLLVPAQPGATEAGQLNPYLGFGSALGIVGELTARKMNDVAMGQRLYAEGATAAYIVDTVPGEAPMLQVTATSTDKDSALRTAKIVDSAISRDLRESQLALGSPKNLLIQTKPVTTATEAVLKRGSQIRAIAAVLVLGVAGTIFAAFTLEGLRVRRERRKADPTFLDRGTKRRFGRAGPDPTRNGVADRDRPLVTSGSDQLRR